jgi:hypothetical protein
MSEQALVTSTASKTQFVQNIQKWAWIDTQLKRINEKTREMREHKSALSGEICEYMKSRNLESTKIEITDGEIRLAEKKDYTPLTFDYIETTLGKIVKDESQVKYIIKALKENRKTTTHPELRRTVNKVDVTSS